MSASILGEIWEVYKFWNLHCKEIRVYAVTLLHTTTICTRSTTTICTRSNGGLAEVVQRVNHQSRLTRHIMIMSCLGRHIS